MQGINMGNIMEFSMVTSLARPLPEHGAEGALGGKGGCQWVRRLTWSNTG